MQPASSFTFSPVKLLLSVSKKEREFDQQRCDSLNSSLIPLLRKYLLVKHDDGLVEGIQRLPLEQDLLGGALVLLVVGVVATRLLVVAPVDLLQPRLHHLKIVHAA